MHRTRHDLLVESPQILDRSAPSRDDQHVDLGAFVRRRDCPRDFGGGAFALHRRRIEDDGHGGPPPSQRGQNVGERGGARRRHDTDGPRKCRQRSLAFHREPPGGREPRFEALEFLVQRADAGEAHRLDIELELAARFVNRRRGTDLDRETVLQRESGELGLLPEEHAAHLCRAVLQVEVTVTRGGASEIGDLAGNPDEAQMPFEDQPGRTDEKPDRDDCRRAATVGGDASGSGGDPALAVGRRKGFHGPESRASGLTRCSERQICPGQNLMRTYRAELRPSEGNAVRQYGRAAVANPQIHEIKHKIQGGKLSTTTFSSA